VWAVRGEIEPEVFDLPSTAGARDKAGVRSHCSAELKHTPTRGDGRSDAHVNKLAPIAKPLCRHDGGVDALLSELRAPRSKLVIVALQNLLPDELRRESECQAVRGLS